MDLGSLTSLDQMQMTQQIQMPVASVEELAEQNEELRQCLSHENSNVPPYQCN